jgi:hypothetical protein
LGGEAAFGLEEPVELAHEGVRPRGWFGHAAKVTRKGSKSRRRPVKKSTEMAPLQGR